MPKQFKSLPSSKLPGSVAQMAFRLSHYGLPLGTNTASGKEVYLSPKRIARHVQLIGPPGTGKTRVLLGIFQALCAQPDATVIMMNPKGALCRAARDWMIQQGITNRLVWFEPDSEGASIGYNPMQPNGLPVATHAKVVREGIASSRGQHSFDETPQLARMLFYSLATARMFNLGLIEALEILRPGSRLRKMLLPRIKNPFLYQSLAYLDSLSASRQEELVASSIARLEPFLCDPTIFKMLTHTPSLDVADVIARNQVLLVNLEIGHPLVEDDVKLFGRFLVNDILNSVRRVTRDRKPSPVYLICDEVQFFMTRDLCQALATGRELGLHLIAAHQELSQLLDEDKGGDLYHSLMGCARTRLLFGGLSFEDLKILVPDVMADQYSPRLVKDEITSLEIEPVESTREVVTNGTSIGGSLGINRGTSSSASRGRAHGVSRQFGSSYTHGEGVSSLHSYGTSFGVGDGETIMPNGEVIATAQDTDGTSEMNATGITASDSYGESASEGEQYTTSESQAHGTQTSVSASANAGTSTSRAIVPFVEQHVRRAVSSRSFVTPEEFDRSGIRAIKGQPDAHYVLKTDGHPALFCQALYIPHPVLLPERRAAAMAKLFTQNIYTKAPASLAAAPATYQSPNQVLEFSDTPPAGFLEPKKEEDK